MTTKQCLKCGKTFTPKSPASKYCSDFCRKAIRKDKQKTLMKQKRKSVQFANKKQPKKHEISNRKPKKITNLKKHYTELKNKILKNEKVFGYQSRVLIEGIEIHEDDFVEKLLKKIKEKK